MHISFPTNRIGKRFATNEAAQAEASRLNALPELSGWRCGDEGFTLTKPTCGGWNACKFAADAIALPYDGGFIVEYDESFKGL